jgi:hypothetical protein
MNIYQNGAFSEILHKLTKYQALAASASNSSKQNLYSQKIQEYKNRLDKMNFNQSGGMTGGLSPENQNTKGDIIKRIGKLVPEEFKTAYTNLLASHKYVLDQLNTLGRKVNQIISELKLCREQKIKDDTELGKIMNELRKKGDDGAAAATTITEKTQQLNSLREQLTVALAGQKDDSIIQDLRRRMEILQSDYALEIDKAQRRFNIEGLVDKARITTLQSQIADLESRLRTSQAELEDLRRNKTGSENCDTVVAEILNDITAALDGVQSRNGSPEAGIETSIDTLRSMVEEIVNKVATRT